MKIIITIALSKIIKIIIRSNNNSNNNSNIINNNITEAFSSFLRNNNSTISNAMNNDATIDSKNSIMNIDLKYQKKIDDLERDILNNQSKNENDYLHHSFVSS